ncbi:MAG: hypothetical protein B7Y90_18225 [Alphaproteobacteria bacterium 32-64-14]|nr:MAG: hypothetical protein B7Y90_18225 [Alphaproteobacteria bacterium 32-64-14]
MANGKIELELFSNQARIAYVTLPKHPGSASKIAHKMVRLESLIPGYEGPEVLLDFGDNNELIGIEILS